MLDDCQGIGCGVFSDDSIGDVLLALVAMIQTVALAVIAAYARRGVLGPPDNTKPKRTLLHRRGRSSSSSSSRQSSRG